MNTYYTSEKNVQILIALLKAHGIKKIVASPGATNITFVASIQQDPYFEIFSAIDERSAAYIACGMAAESGEPVVLSCTGATASRNYLPGLTEAFYRKLPILAVTSTQHIGRIGQNFPQVIDRTNCLNDTAKISVQVPNICSDEDEWACQISINKAILELFRNGGGPAHINLATSYSKDFSIKTLPRVKVIKRIQYNDTFPDISNKKVAIFVGSHKKWTTQFTEIVDEFCEKYNAIVICDHTSNYKGKYGVLSNLVFWQESYLSQNRFIDLVIDIGNVSGGYVNINLKEAWRINPDGEIRDSFKKLTYIFQMNEIDFFKHYNDLKSNKEDLSFYKDLHNEYNNILSHIPTLPFSNIWIAQNSCKLVPENTVLHLGILNTLRAWDFFELSNNESISVFANTGGFGIDGNTSSLIGSSLASDKIHIGIVGDLSFFYDMNSIGNRHIGSNMRLMIINNGVGTEFKNYSHPAARFGEDANDYMAAAGHYGNKSPNLIKSYVQNLGFKYLTASDKETYLKNAKEFFSPDKVDYPICFEVFTNDKDESDALKLINNSLSNTASGVKKFAKEVLGEKGFEIAKTIIRR